MLVIVENVEGEPLVPAAPGAERDGEDTAHPPLPPPPTAIGKLAAVTVILFPGVEYPSKGLAV